MSVEKLGPVKHAVVIDLTVAIDVCHEFPHLELYYLGSLFNPPDTPSPYTASCIHYLNESMCSYICLDMDVT